MLIPVPQNLEGKRAGVSPALTKALESLLGPRGARWDVQSFFAPFPSYEIEIPALADVAAFNTAFPRFAEGVLVPAA